MKNGIAIVLTLCVVSLISMSCEDKDMYKGYWVDELNDIKNAYIYPYANENQGVVAEITIETDGTVDLNNVQTEIPHLKYNKSWIFMLTQDDCKHESFCVTWAAIHNRPIPSNTNNYYDYVHLKANDMPSKTQLLKKTLGSTDGAGNEVRFSFTTTVAPEWDFMNAKSVVALRENASAARFYNKSGVTWRSLIEMLNYDVGIAFHDVKASNVNDADSILEHYKISQSIILEKLSGRGCKVLAEPNGNKTYITAARSYPTIQAITAQAGAQIIKPLNEERDLRGVIQERWFIEPAAIKQKISDNFVLPADKNQTIHIGVHGTNVTWANFLLWLNNSYGKDGEDDLWMPSMEEYYEYNYNRVHGTVEKTVQGNTLKIKVTLPGEEYFYFPSTTVNLIGLNMDHVVSVSSSNSVTGLSYANFRSTTEPNKNNLMVNLDCRSSLIDHAEHYVKEAEANKEDEALKADALYFISKLKDSEKKKELLRRMQ